MELASLQRQEKALIALHVSKGRTLRLKEFPDCPMWVSLLRIDMCKERGPIRLWFSNYRSQGFVQESYAIFNRVQTEIRQANHRINEESATEDFYIINVRKLISLMPVVERVSELHLSSSIFAERDYRRLRAAAQNWISQNSMPENLLDVFGLEPPTLQVESPPLPEFEDPLV